MPALLYGFFACYAVTGKCELRTDSEGRDLAVFTSLEDCQRFGSGPAQQRPNSEGKWLLGDGHYYQCLSMTPGAPAATPASAAPSTTAPAVAAAAMAGAVAAKSASVGATATAAPAAVQSAPAAAAKPAATTAPATAAVGATATPATAAIAAASTAPAAAAVAAPRPDAERPVYKTTAEALQQDFQTNPEALNRKIGNAVVEVSGTVVDRAKATDGELQLSGRSSDVTVWLTNDGITGAQALSKHANVTLSCDRIGTLVAASGRRPGIVEVRDCRVLHGG